MKINLPKRIIVMKIGVHAGENLEDIISRKKTEGTNSGIYWGYGGTLIHPTRQVIPFVIESLNQGSLPLLFMCKTTSKLQVSKEPIQAKQYSVDGRLWESLPDGVKITGSKYALICKSITNDNFQIKANNYIVATGRRRGEPLDKYMKYHIDKACACYKDSIDESLEMTISCVGELCEPYAVLLR
jgi:hypothetical protein